MCVCVCVCVVSNHNFLEDAVFIVSTFAYACVIVQVGSTGLRTISLAPYWAARVTLVCVRVPIS